MSEESPKKLKCIWIALKYIKIYIVENQFHLSALNWMSGRVYAKNKHKTEEKKHKPVKSFRSRTKQQPMFVWNWIVHRSIITGITKSAQLK